MQRAQHHAWHASAGLAASKFTLPLKNAEGSTPAGYQRDRSLVLSTMECTIAESNGMRVFARVIQCAAKIGEDLTFTPSSAGLHIRTVNASHSACAEYIFRRPFFSTFSTPPPPAAAPTARVSARSLLPVLRGPGNIVASTLALDASATALVIRVTARSGVRKTFRVPVNDGTTPGAVYDKSSCTSYMLTRPRFLVDVLSNFHARLDEITFAPGDAGLRVASFVDDAAGTDPQNAMLRTEMAVDAREFDVFRVAAPPDLDAAIPALTFYCRPFRAVLEFCEALEAPMSVRFAASGDPLVFSVEMSTPGGAAYFEADFVFATRLVDVVTQPPATPGCGAYSNGNDTSNSRESSGNALAPKKPALRSAARRRPKLSLTQAAASPNIGPSAQRPPIPAMKAARGAKPAKEKGRLVKERPGSAGSHTGASPGVQASVPAATVSGPTVVAVDGCEPDIILRGEKEGVDTEQDVAMPTQYDDDFRADLRQPRHHTGNCGSESYSGEDDEDDGEYVAGTPPPE
jgi:Rad9